MSEQKGTGAAEVKPNARCSICQSTEHTDGWHNNGDPVKDDTAE